MQLETLAPDINVSLEELSLLVPSHHQIAVFPGFCDVHVHFREPGFSYKETVKSGSLAAAHGGFTTVGAMPNLNPVPDSLPHLKEELRLIRRDACIEVLPYGSLSVGQKGERLADLEAMAPYVLGFSDDGRGLQDPALMKEAMQSARALGKLIVAHCEDNTLLHGGYIHAGRYAESHGHRGIISESEWGPIKRDIALLRESGAAYHVCHVSCKESVELIRAAKREGLDISCETAPHYLLLDDSMLQEDGRFKMNPPIRSAEDREALIEGLLDGTVDMIATDHAPHSAEEKSRGLEKSVFGIVGIETAFPLLYTYLVKEGRMSLEMLIDKMNTAPRARFRLPEQGYCIWDLDAQSVIDPNDFLSLGRSTPFEGVPVFARCLKTVSGGQTAYHI